jgi:ABC-2 type transport system permease protein
MSAVYKRELKSLFTGMIAPIFISVLLLFCGIYTVSACFSSGYTMFERVIPTVGYVFLIIVPILTMQSFAAEKSEKTDQSLYSLPISTSSVVLGKYLAMVSVLGAASLAMCLIPIILSFYGTVYFPTAYASILAFFIMGSSLIAIGMFISSLTESQVISAVISIAVFLTLSLISYISSFIPTTAIASFIIVLVLAVLVGFIVWIMTKNGIAGTAVGAVLAIASIVVYFIKSELYESLVPDMLGKLGLFEYMTNFVYGIFDLKALVFYLSIILLFVFLTGMSFDKKRWN